MDNGHETTEEAFEVRSDQFAIVPVWLVAEVSHSAVALYAVLAGKYANHVSGRAFPTHLQLAEDLACTDRSIRTWMAELEAVGALTRTRGRPGRASVYTLKISRSVRKSGDNSESARQSGSGVPEGDFRAARKPASDQPEDLYNQKGAATAGGGRAPAAAPETRLGRGVNAPPIWELDDDGNARRIRNDS